ncbi:AAA family ATPase [Providencia rettgeri]|uniref:AAA family ATPase n=1 Tax=Providencia rettgeri TaxID=587 RepID=UPI00244C7C94|nr:AAA family ATPase [Providencia rettgeri]MDH2371894.1 AAA family ATPase [Providencia rettgeri]
MKKNKNPTRVNSIEVVKFRGLEDVTINFGKRITAICGKNGTSKSTILGILAQVFSFRDDVSIEPPIKLTDYKTLTGKGFKSEFSEHFRFSEKHDVGGKMHVKLSVYDAYTGITPPDLELRIYDYSDRNKARPVVRKNTTIEGKNESRNLTHPVIFLSLRRLLPITLRDEYNAVTSSFLEDNKSDIRAMYQYLTGKDSSNLLTGTVGTINSMVMHSDCYDHESVSVGEDNIGQIVQSLFSFRRLKSQYADYHGGLLLIDEADAGLFPAAQKRLIEVLEKECKKYDLQVVLTTHSPTLIETLHKLSQNDRENNYKVVYLTDTYGKLESMEDCTWLDINSDLHVETIEINNELSLPRVNVYFEDKQAYQLYSALIRVRQINNIAKPLKEIAMSCSSYISLMQCKVPEFTSKSIVVLDGDVMEQEGKRLDKVLKNNNLVFLPTKLAPDQLLFEFFYNLPADDPYWKNNPIKLTKPVFKKIANEIITQLNIEGETIDLYEYIKNHKNDKSETNKLRDLFKNFNTNSTIEKLISGKIEFNPYAVWAKRNKSETEIFVNRMRESLKSVLSNGHHISDTLIEAYFIE